MPDLFKISCPKCRTQIQVKAESAGAVVGCPRCGTKMRVPAPAPAPASAPAPETPPDPENSEVAPPPPVEIEGVGSKISVPALGYLGASAALFLLSGIILYWSIRHWSFKSNFQDAIRQHDAANPSQVGASCEAALKWNPAYAPAQELRAKVLVDSGSLDQAEGVYLLPGVSNRPAAIAGLAAVYLRKADREKNPAQSAALAAKAREYYQRAKIPEGTIGLGLVSLLEAVKKNNDPNLLREAKAQLESAAKSLRDVGREGLADLYAALSSVAAKLGEDPTEASENGRRAAELGYPWSQPLATVYLLRAKELVEHPLRGDDYRRGSAPLKQELLEAIERTNNRMLFGDVVPAMNELVCSCVIIFLFNLDFDATETYCQRMKQNSTDLYLTLSTLNYSWAKVIDLEDFQFRDAVSRIALPECERLASLPEVRKPERAADRAIVYNNLAAYREFLPLSMKLPPADYNQSREYLRLALEANPNEYAAQRNLAVLLKRLYLAETVAVKKKTWGEEAAKAFTKAQEIAAASTESWIADDLGKLKEYCQRP